MTVNKLVYDVREALKQYMDDSEISDRYIIYLWNLKRSKYLRNDLNNLQKTVDNSVTQKLCMELEEVSINDCNIDYECDTIVRTKQVVPKPLELNLGSAITSVRPTNKIALSFNFLNKERAINSKHSKFPKGIYAFLDTDMHIYLISETPTVNLIECITVSGIFEDPLELMNYTNCCGCDDEIPCYDLDLTDYPLPAHHVDSIRGEIVTTLIKTLQIPEDKNNNADDQ
jgi:hypothetical protein